MLTIGYTSLAKVSSTSIDARELRDGRGATVRGLVVDVTQSQYRQERSFVDVDEIPELIKGANALLEVQANPTTHKNFEVRYTTKGQLEITAYNDDTGKIEYVVQAGRGVSAKDYMNAKEFAQFRDALVAAQTRLAPATLPAR